MKVVQTKDSPTISLDEIDPKKHIIVALLDGCNPCLGQYEWGRKDAFRFHPLDNEYTMGNYYLKHIKGNAKTVINKWLEVGAEIHAFASYREALKWIIDNT